MDVTVIVAASTTSTRDTAEHPTVGDLADAVAAAHEVAGSVFTLKVNGEPYDRSAPTDRLTGDEVLELIELPDSVTASSLLAGAGLSGDDIARVEELRADAAPSAD